MKDVSTILNELDRICTLVPGSEKKVNGRHRHALSGGISPERLTTAVSLLSDAIDALVEVKGVLQEFSAGSLEVLGNSDVLRPANGFSSPSPQDLLPPESAAIEAAKLKALEKIRGQAEKVDEGLDDGDIPFVGQVPVEPDEDANAQRR